MKKKYALYVTDASLILCAVDSKGVHLVYSQGITTTDFDQTFDGYFSKLHIPELAVFLDLIGEEFKHESIPHISRRDRGLLMSRKEQSLFPTADWVWKNHIKREKQGRRDDVYLLMGVQVPKNVTTILEVLVKNNQAVSGVYSISVLESEIQDVIPNNDHYLTVSRVADTQTLGRSYRQTFHKDQEIDISRTTRANGDSFDEVFSVLMAEIERMHHFLRGSKKVDENHKLEVLVALGEKESSQLLSKQFNNDITFKYIDLYELTKKLGLPRPKSVSSLPQVLINYALVKKVKPHFQPEELCGVYKKRQLKHWIQKATVSVLAISFLLSIAIGWETNHAKQRIEEINQLISELEEQQQDMGSALHEVDVKPKLMKDVVTIHQVIAENQYTPEEVLSILSKAYEGFNDIAIMGISWLSEGMEEGLDEQNHADFTSQVKKEKQFSLQITLPNSMTEREAINRVNDFTASLLEQKGVLSVSEHTSSLDIKSSSTLERSVSARAGEDQPIDFTLLITMKLS